jgi:putative SbcD/Mre11-related phosphoesterase
MEIFDFETVDSLPALYDPENSLLIISDLHLGLEKTMTSKGNYVPSSQLEDIKEDIRKAQEETGASRILVNGDLKNQFRTSYSETEEIEEFLNFLRAEFEEVIIIKGNHDTFIESTLEKVDIALKDHFLEDGKLYIHGHEELGKHELQDFDTVLIGHEHPAIALEDEIGVREKIPALLYGPMEKDRSIIAMPAFSRIANGTAVNEVPERKLLSPVLKKNADKDKLKAVGISREAGLFEFPELHHLK